MQLKIYQENAIDDLYKIEFLTKLKKTGEWHVTLNRATLPEVLREIQ